MITVRRTTSGHLLHVTSCCQYRFPIYRTNPAFRLAIRIKRYTTITLHRYGPQCPAVSVSSLHMRFGRKIGLNKKCPTSSHFLNSWSNILPNRVQSQAKRLDSTQPISYWSRYLCCFYLCMYWAYETTHSVPVTASRQCRILSTNVHWRNSLVGFRCFTLQVKIPSLGFASSAYARRPHSIGLG